MNAIEYYELPYGVADRMELQNFLLADHYEGAEKAKKRERIWEPKSTNEMLAEWPFQLTHNVELSGN